MPLELISYVVAKIRAVGCVTINEEIGIPFVPEAQLRLRLRRVCLHVIAVQIQICRVGAPAHRARAVLINSIVRVEAFVPVRVVNWNEEQDNVIEQIFICLCDRNVAQEGESGVFAVRFARVDASLHKHNCFFLFSGRLRREGVIFRCDEQRQRAILRAATKICEANCV